MWALFDGVSGRKRGGGQKRKGLVCTFSSPNPMAVSPI